LGHILNVGIYPTSEARHVHEQEKHQQEDHRGCKTFPAKSQVMESFHGNSNQQHSLNFISKWTTGTDLTAFLLSTFINSWLDCLFSNFDILYRRNNVANRLLLNIT